AKTPRKSWWKRTSRAAADPANRNGRLRPGWRREARRAVGVDVPHALVVLTESGREHEARTELVHARNLVREGHPAGDLLGEFMYERFDLREEAEHLLVHAASLRG